MKHGHGCFKYHDGSIYEVHNIILTKIQLLAPNYRVNGKMIVTMVREP